MSALSEGDEGLELRLEFPLPDSIPAGRGTALFLYGSCFHRHSAVTGLDVVVGEHRHPVRDLNMPRPDLFRAHHPLLGDGEADADHDPGSAEDPELRSFRSGFWAVVPVTPTAEGTLGLAVEAALEDRSRAGGPLGAVEVTPPPPPPGEGPTIAICMATHEPDPGLLVRQVESIRAQTDRDWICVISDDASSPSGVAAIEAAVEGDSRFTVWRSDERLGFYRNFERAISLAPPTAGLVALADQDDAWHPDKLATLRAALGDANLVYSDQRLVRPDGTVISGTYWTSRRNNHTNLASLLIANSVTGAASLFRREVADLALPFPGVPGVEYHDHWIALLALATGRIDYVDRPLYDYVQHGEAALGHTEANLGVARSGKRGPVAKLRIWRRSMDDWRFAYFSGYLRLKTVAIALAARGGARTPARRRRVLRRFAAAERSAVAAAWLALRLLRPRLGRDETLGFERLLLRGIAWRRLAGLRRGGAAGAVAADAALPPARQDSPPHGDAATAHLEAKIGPLELTVSPSAPERVNVLVPTIDLRHLFGGYIAKFNLARRLAEAGRRVRIVTVDPTGPLPRSWRRQVESYAGLSGLFDRVEVEFARDSGRPLKVSPLDSFVATTFWTARIAREAVAATERDRFLYLIQEYEPYTFVMGSWAAVARETYEYPHVALFSTELLREFFAARGYGVYAQGREAGDRASVSFQNAITAVEGPAAADLAARDTRRLLFYARPEPHAARNMFELGLMSLSRAAAEGVFGPEWELNGIGSVQGRDSIPLPGAQSLRILTRRDQSAYAALLREHDVGLALMFTPHPSLVPIEMASAGMLAVTNSFETKTAEAMAAISPNLIAADPTPDGVVEGLEEAVRRVGEHESRAAGATVRWSRDWETSLDDEITGRVLSLLDAC